MHSETSWLNSIPHVAFWNDSWDGFILEFATKITLSFTQRLSWDDSLSLLRRNNSLWVAGSGNLVDRQQWDLLRLSKEIRERLDYELALRALHKYHHNVHLRTPYAASQSAVFKNSHESFLSETHWSSGPWSNLKLTILELAAQSAAQS